MGAVFLAGVPLWAVALALPLVLLEGWLLGSAARWLLRGRARLGVSTSIVIAVLGTSIGLLVAGWLAPDSLLWSPLTLLLALGTTVVAMAGYGAVAAHFQRPQRQTAAELLRAGESERVEFKSTARVNLRTGAKDERMEQVVAKTACAFLNADGGTLVVGVDDRGAPLGLSADLATMKSPDVDRYELWLRDLFTTTLGQAAAAGIQIQFPEVPGDSQDAVTICTVTCTPSPRPVYLRPSRGAAPELWVRSGNSTRQLAVDAAAEYVMHRWPLGTGSNLAAQLRAAVRFSEEH
ncbi:helix-turn-helix domain-containing protein [Propionicimonas sp.]|uniref:AlbA family DNA-binding domain-containing protein n=1 Tax=Propionicimonas sp. TaxID=1955623 RepID=UPI0039E59368